MRGWSRKKKIDQLIKHLNPSDTDRLLEVGVAATEWSSVDNYLLKNYPYPAMITALGLGNLERLRNQYPKVQFVQYDGVTFPFPDNSFDVSHANAVIEHVGPKNAQVKFLSEMVRVSKRGMITTPNRWFPIEIHTRLPFFHWLPKKRFDAICNLLGKSWATGNYMYLLDYASLNLVAKLSGLASYKIISNKLVCSVTYTLIWIK